MNRQKIQEIQEDLGRIGLKAVGDNIIAIPLQEIMQTKSGLVLDTSQESTGELIKGFVISVGPKATEVKEGEIIGYVKAHGWQPNIAMNEVRIIRESFVLARITEGTNTFINDTRSN